MRYWGFNMIGLWAPAFSPRHVTTAARSTPKPNPCCLPPLVFSSALRLSFRPRLREEPASNSLSVLPKDTNLSLPKNALSPYPQSWISLLLYTWAEQKKPLFGKYIRAGYYVSLVRNSGFPNNTAISNAAQDTPCNFPHLPVVYSISPSGVDGVEIVYSDFPQSKDSFPWADDAVKADIIQSIKTLQKINPDKFQQTKPEIIEYYSHAPCFLQVSAEEIKKGFYSKLYALQGQKEIHTELAPRGECRTAAKSVSIQTRNCCPRCLHACDIS